MTNIIIDVNIDSTVNTQNTMEGIKMATYGVKVINESVLVNGRPYSTVLRNKLTKEEAISFRDAMLPVADHAELKLKIFIEMNQHEKMVNFLIQQGVSEWIGGLENTLLDYPEDSEEYQNAKADLNHDTLFGCIYNYVMDNSRGNYASHIRFAGKKFIEERIESILIKEGYGKVTA